MSPNRRATGALNRRAFLKRSLPTAAVVASGADLLPQALQAQNYDVDDEKCIDLRFVKDLMEGPRRFGDLTPPNGPPTFVIHFFGLVAFVNDERGPLADRMRVLLPNSKGAPHRARLWAPKSFSGGTNYKCAGDYRYWDLNLSAGTGTRIKVVKEGGFRLRTGRQRNHPWEDCDFISNLKELFPKGDLWSNKELKNGAGGRVVTYLALPGGGRLVSGVPWSRMGNDAIWRYQIVDPGSKEMVAEPPVRERTLTDNVSFFRTLDEKEPTAVALQLDSFKGAEGENEPKRSEVSLYRNGQNIISCVITHAIPNQECLTGHPAHGTQRVLEHSEFYYQLFKNEDVTNRPIPVFARSVRGLDYGEYQRSLQVVRDRIARQGGPKGSIDDTHCECALWM